MTMAILTGLANTILHGVALLGIRRYRSGIALLAVEAAVLTAVFARWAPA